MNFKISVDTGGTFTDVIVRDPSGVQHIGKALTTYNRVFDGLGEAIKAAGSKIGLSLEQLLEKTDMFIYGTTRATNAIVTRNVAKTAFLTTQGFPDVLVLKEGGKKDGYDFSKRYPDPYIPRRYTFEIPERIDAQGRIVCELDKAAIGRILDLLEEGKFEAIAVCLLWSVVNPVHEAALGAMIAERLPNVPFTLSHQLSPVIREYRRGSATAIDASLKPLMQKHFQDFEADLRRAGYRNELLVSTSVGGVMTIDQVINAPINTAKSGPSMAPVAGIAYSRAEGLGDNMIVCDTGGTTFDVGLSRDGNLVYSRDTWLGGPWEGDILGISSVDIRSIGAGGGSIAWIDSGGLLRVGPQSAGSEPGPACYGRGGTLPTVSDAACVLGYFNPKNFLGGRMDLDGAAALRAIATIAGLLNLTVEATAWGILRLAGDHMVKAIHEITVFQGINPLDCTLVAGGGAAGINIMQIARELGASKVVMPKVASALSASGMQFADIVVEEATSLIESSDRFRYENLASAMADIKARLDAAFQRIDQGRGASFTIDYIADARYKAQVWELGTPVPGVGIRNPAQLAEFVETFHAQHARVLGIRDPDSPVEMIGLRGRLIARLDKPKSRADSDVAPGEPVHDQVRTCFFGAGPVPTPIFDAAALLPGMTIPGPAIIEEPTTTIVVLPEMSASVSGAGNYILHTR